MRISQLFFRLSILVLFLPQLGQAADPNWRSPMQVEGAITTSLEEAKALYDAGVPFVDVRNPRLYTKKHIPGAHHLNLKSGFSEDSLEMIVNRDEPVVIYCSGVKCSRSYRASIKAVSWGFKAVHYFRGGVVEWRDAGYPMKYADKE